MQKAKKFLFKLVNIFLVLSMFMLPASRPVLALSPDIVISQVYGGGGNSGATYTHDFIELFNRGTSSVSLAGWSLQYASATGTGNFGSSSTQLTELPSVTLAPGQYLLVQEAQGSGGTISLPTPDVIDSSPIAMSGTAGKVALVMSNTSLGCNGGSTPCNSTQLALIKDLIGWNTANFYETAAAPATTNTTAALRLADGCTETDNNSLDFASNAPTPRNTASPLNLCTVVPPTILINEIDSDTPGTDIAEFIELYDGGVGNSALDGLVVVFYNGSNDLSYASYDLDGFSTDADGYFLLGNAGVTPTPSIIFASNGLQNGQDAVALYADDATTFPASTAVTTTNLLDAIVYDTSDADDPGLLVLLNAGQPQVNENGGGNGAGQSNQRCPNGSGGALNTDTYAQFAPTAGGVNTCVAPVDEVKIHEIQGNGATSPLVGQTVAIEGIVVSDFQDGASGVNGDLNGFHVQEEDADADADPLSSEGIFVYDGSSPAVNVNIGDLVYIEGSVSEYNGLTEMTSFAGVKVVSSGNPLPTASILSLPVTSADYFERFEGMLVTFPQALVISEYYNFGRYGEIVLTSERHLTPSAEFEPGPLAIQAAADFLLDKITLDDGRSAQNPNPAIHPNGNNFDLTNLFRGGDTVANVTGIMDYSFSLYRIQPTQGADYTAANPRPSQPQDVGGTLKVASFNVLNYFSTIDQGRAFWICGPSQNMECRGADTAEEFTRQRDKTIAALEALNADVVGVFEIENNVNDDALKDLVDGLNAKIGSVTYAYIDTGTIGTDAIKVAIIYKPAAVSLVGNFAILDTSVDPRFLDTKNRPSLAQSFKENSSNDVFTLVVNHLKSKGSDCNDLGDPDTGDGSGNCNITRTLAAQALVDWLAGDPTHSEDSDYLIVGDLNSYDKEAPIDAILAGPDDILGTSDDYSDMVFNFQGEAAYSYVFDGQIGYLDHALASASLIDQVTGLTDWHINADEPNLIDYDMSFKLPAQDALYESNPYRSSDHDPVVIGLDLTYQMKPIATACPEGLTISRYGYTVTIPPGAVSECVDIYLENENMTAGPINPNGYLSLDYRVQIFVKKSNGSLQSTFNPPLEVCVDYSDEDLAKVGSDPNYLKIWTAQKGATAWQMLATTPYPVQKQGCAQVSHLSYFDLFFAPDSTPATGFAPDRLTSLPIQTVDKSFTDLGNLWVEIPRLGVSYAITGVPLSGGEWDVSWLNDQVGWLEGTAFPSWDGNSVITGHVYDSNGLPGPFVNLNQLWYGDQIIIHAFGESHVYEIQTIFQVKPDAVKSILKHEEESWLTLITCRGYDPVNDTYLSRYIIRAINVDDK